MRSLFCRAETNTQSFFGVRSIKVFSKFSLDPYHEPLLWFMITLESVLKAVHETILLLVSIFKQGMAFTGYKAGW